jgi:tetratricopeptide (TPR) repeat protein
MPCCHTFCKSCLSRLDQEKCPNCNGWISLKSVNWGLLNLIPEKQRQKQKLLNDKHLKLDKKNRILAADWNNIGINLAKIKKYLEAIDAFDRAILSRPSYALAYCNRGFCLLELKRYEDAIESFNKAIKLKPNYGIAYLNKGIALNNLKRYSEAVYAYDRAILIGKLKKKNYFSA